MTEAIVLAEKVSKKYGPNYALHNVDLKVDSGEIVGIFGPNGAGKTTFLRALLGLGRAEGKISVLGRDVDTHPSAMMTDVSFIADTATLPRWIRVEDCLDYVECVHPRFSRARVEEYLARTNIAKSKKISQLSKGMITQLHLAIVMSIDSKLLVLDEPTLGLDIVYRKTFYSNLLDNYFDQNKTILITTHQIEEIEDIVTRIVFIDNGSVLLDAKVDELAERFFEVKVGAALVDVAQALSPLYSSSGLEGKTFWYDSSEEKLQGLGELKTPKLADLFVAKVMHANNGGLR